MRCAWAALVLGLLAPGMPLRAAEEALSTPSPEHSLQAFEQVRAWVRSGAVPPEPVTNDPGADIGACVTLRLGGRVIGRAASLEADRANLWRAVRQAMMEAAPALGADAPGRDGLLGHVSIDLQLSGRRTPLLGEDFESATSEVAPGIDGVAARVGDRFEAIFPGTMLATGSTPAEALRVCAARLSLPPSELGELRRRFGISVYVFSACHLAQPSPDQAPTFLTRGGRIVGLSEVSGLGLRRCAAAIAAHLYSHAWPGTEPHGMTGDYDPLSDRYNPLIAPPMSQGVVALAMARYADVPGLSPAERDRAIRFAARLIEGLARVAPEEPDPGGQPADAAMVLAAMLELQAVGGEGTLSVPRAFGESLGDALKRCVAESGQWSAQCPPEARSIVAMGLAALACSDLGGPEDRARADSAVRSLFRDTDRARLAAEMPWLGWAELRLARDPASPVPSGGVLRDLRDACWLHQLDESRTDSSSSDLAGGILFTRGRTLLPTWHTLRPVAVLATMVGDTRLTDGAELSLHVAALKRSLRFLMQLQTDRIAAHMHRDPDRSLGGIRAAPWDQREPLEASALGLMAISETLGALAARSGSPAPAPPPAAR